MANKPAAPGKAAPVQQAVDPKTASRIVMRLILVTIVLTALSSGLIFLGYTYVMVLIVVSMLPAVVAHVVDRRPRRWASRTVMFFNIAGLLPHLFDIMMSHDPNAMASHLLSDPYIWLVIYGFAGFGWLFVYIVPQIVFLFLVVRSDHSIRKLEAKRQELVDEWGDKVRGGLR